MGWTGYPKGMTKREAFETETAYFNFENNTIISKVISKSLIGSKGYVLSLITKKETGEVTSNIDVCLLETNNGSVCIKSISEGSSPFYYAVPKKMLEEANKYEPFSGEAGKEYREKVAKYLSEKEPSYKITWIDSYYGKISKVKDVENVGAIYRMKGKKFGFILLNEGLSLILRNRYGSISEIESAITRLV